MFSKSHAYLIFKNNRIAVTRNSSPLLNMKNILSILFVFQLFNIHSQTFDYQYDNNDNNGGHETFSDVIVLDSGYLLVGSDFPINEGIEKSFIVNINDEGFINWSYSLSRDSSIGSEIHNAFKYDENYSIIQGIILYEDTSSTFPQKDFFLTKINHYTGDTLWTKLYGSDSLVESSTRTIKTLDGGFAMTGIWIDGNNPTWVNTILIKTDSLANQEYINEYTDINNPTYDFLGRSLVQTPDSGFLLLAEVRIPSWLDQIGIIKTDKYGNQEWVKYIPAQGNEKFNIGLDIITTDDGGYLTGGAKHFNLTLDTMRYAVHKISSDGEVTWIKTYGGNAQAAFTKMIKSQDGSGCILVGLEHTSNTVTPRVSWGVIAKIDNDGCMQWIRNYQSAQDDVQSGKLNNIKATPDGGYIAVGTGRRDDSTFQNGWAIKTDEWGCVVPGCQYIVTSDCDGTTPIEEVVQEEVEIKVFPNPTNGRVVLKSNHQNIVEVKVYNTSGQLLHFESIRNTEAELNLEEMISGIYILQIRLEEGLVWEKLVKQ